MEKNNQNLDQMLDLIVDKKQNSLEESIGFSSAIFMLFGLPTKRLKDNPTYWEKKNNICEFTITRDKKYEIPYGCYARMNQIFIDTEVKTKDTNIIDLGHSFRPNTNVAAETAI